ncbi:MAG: peptidoglycan-binding domain-containing protein, partial [Candidatus Pacebacteria bacterium]|nr:peptidoglycan-binding domain-containing protein [Candidatus Paceibacterota bacterium]
VTSIANAALTEAQITSILSLLSTFGADATTVANVNASLRGQATTGTTTTTTGTAVSTVLANSGALTVGSRGEAVKALQQYLNANGAVVATSGAGSVGNETTYFGNATKAALAKWQAANGVSPAAGYFGSITKAKMVSLAGGATTTTTTGTTTTTTTTSSSNGTLTVSAGVQPVSSLAPASSSNVPFTKVVLTATGGAVTVNSLTVERQGLAADAVFSSVVLLDENGNQIGLTKTLNANHQASIGEAFTIAAGSSRTLTIAANRAAYNGTYNGMTVSLALVGISATPSITLASNITGATHTVNETLTIGSVSVARGPLDPGAGQTKEVGTTGYTFSSLKITAGSAEKVYLKSIRWNQTGSVGSADLANLKTYVDGVAYDSTISSDGKYYLTNFGTALLIDKGGYKEVSIKGDIVGGSARTIDFDVAKRTDIVVVGETYGYGILAAFGSGTTTTLDDGEIMTADDPYYDAYQAEVSAGTMTVSTWNGVAAQNIALNLADQPIGGWTASVKGEPISVASLVFAIYTPNDTTAEVDMVKLVKEDGTVVAGPVDPTGTGTTGTITFTDTITFPVGTTNLKLLAKMSTDIGNGHTINASTSPQTQWTSATGQTTGKTITIAPNSMLAGQTMTVKGPALTISVSSVPIAQTVIGGNTTEFARYILDTSASGEDIRLVSLPIAYDQTGGAATDVSNCQLYDGTASLTTGSNVKNPTAVSSSTAFTFDGTGLVISKGSSKTLTLKCDLKAAAAGTYYWGYDSDASPSPTGVTSGQSVAAADLVENDSVGQRMTSTTQGSMTVALDSGSPSYAVAAPGQTVELARIKYTATNEDVKIRQVALQLTGGASNTPVDLTYQTVTLNTVDGVQIGTAVFSSGDTATSSQIADGAFTVAKDGYKVLVIKGTIAGISASGPLTASGDLIKVDYDGDNVGTDGNYGVGSSSGSNISGTATDTASSGARIMKSYPTFANIALSTAEKVLVEGDAKTLYKFSVTANNGDIALYKLAFSVSSSSVKATTSKFALYAFTDSAMTTGDSTAAGVGGLVNFGSCYNGLGDNYSSTTSPTSGQLRHPGTLGTGSMGVDIVPDKTGCNTGTTTMVIASGQTRYFKLVGSVSALAASGTSESIQVRLDGDAAFPVNSANLMQKAANINSARAAGIDNDTNNKFIWSPRSTSTAASINDLDWTNGYGLSGLPGTGMTSETLSK